MQVASQPEKELVDWMKVQQWYPVVRERMTAAHTGDNNNNKAPIYPIYDDRSPTRYDFNSEKNLNRDRVYYDWLKLRIDTLDDTSRITHRAAGKQRSECMSR